MEKLPNNQQRTLDQQQSAATLVDALSLMGSQTKSVRILLGAVVYALGLSAAAICDPPWSGVVVAALIMFAFVRSGHTAWLFLFCFAVVAGHTLGGGWRQYGGGLSFVDMLQASLVFLILVAGFRYSELKKYSTAFQIDKVYGQSLDESQRAFAWNIGSTLVRRQWLFSLISMLGAFALLVYLPADDSYLYKYWLQPKPCRLIILGLLLFFAWFLCRAIVGIFEWIRLTPEKADVAFRSWYNREMWREMAGVERRLYKLRMDDQVDNRTTNE